MRRPKKRARHVTTAGAQIKSTTHRVIAGPDLVTMMTQICLVDQTELLLRAIDQRENEEFITIGISKPTA